MDDESVTVGFILAFLLWFAINLFTGFEGAQARLAVLECQRELPRSQYCEITATPIQKDKDNE